MCSRAASQSNFGGGGIFWNREGEVHWFLILISVPNRLPYIHVCLCPNPLESFHCAYTSNLSGASAMHPSTNLVLSFHKLSSYWTLPHISGILLQSLHWCTVRNTAFMSNTSKVGCSRPKTLCLLSGLHFIPFIYFGSLVLSDCIVLLGSIALWLKLVFDMIL